MGRYYLAEAFVGE